MSFFGKDYPNQFEQYGHIFQLIRETRWNRMFRSFSCNTQTTISRFHDGSASITPEELETEWMMWNDGERWDFCNAIAWLPAEGRERICRFLACHATLDNLHNNVLTISTHLPATESVPWLIRCLAQRPPGTASNFLQALAHTKAPEAGPHIRLRLDECFAHPDFAKDDPFLNWIAAESLNAIKDLIELGYSPSDFREQALKLANHICAGVRDSFDRWLRKHYDTDAAFSRSTPETQ